MKKKWMATLLAATLLFSVCGCNEGDNSSGSGGSVDNNSVGNPVVEEKIGESDNYLVKDGKTEYTIVYPADYNSEAYTYYAALELLNFFYEATGITIGIKPDVGLEWSEDAKYISLDDTTISKAAGIKKEIDYGFSGYSITSKGDSVFITGGTFGILNGVYEFLSYQLDFESYAIDEIYIERIKTDEKLLDFQVTKLPSVDVNILSYGELTNNTNYRRRMRLTATNEVFLPLNGTVFHNFYYTFDKPEYKENHPEWFSNGQLDLTIAIDEMTDILVAEWQKWMNESTGTQIALTFTPMDNQAWSTSTGSNELLAKYGTNAAEYIQFVNVAAKKMNAWMEDNYPDREISYCIFSYQRVKGAPVKDDGQGSYVPIDDTVKLEKNVQLFFTALDASFYYSLEEEKNTATVKRHEQWQALSSGGYLYWLYGANFENYFVPLDLTRCLKDNYQFVAKSKGKLVYYEMGPSTVSANWSRLYIYLMSKLGQNCNENVDELIADFFTNYFKDASPAMTKFHSEFTAWYAHLAATTDLSFAYVSEGQTLQAKHWPYAMLQNWLGYIDQAYAAIEHYKTTDEELYKKLYDRITLESLTIRYVVLSLYSVRLNDSKAYGQALLNDCVKLRVDRGGGHSTVREFLAKYL